MDKILEKIIIKYSSVLTADISEDDKQAQIQELSFLLHNELYDEFQKELSSELLEQYDYFVKTAEKFLSKINPDEIKIFDENGIKMIGFRGQKKPLMSAYDISCAFLDNMTKEHVLLLTIFLSNNEDILKMNLIS